MRIVDIKIFGTELGVRVKADEVQAIKFESYSPYSSFTRPVLLLRCGQQLNLSFPVDPSVEKDILDALQEQIWPTKDPYR